MRITELERANGRTAFRKNIIQPSIWLAIALLLFTLFFPLYGRVSVDGDPFQFICLPNGDPLAPRVLRQQLYGETKAYFMNWSTKQFLSPTMSWGHLSFATAKGIDIAWDLLIGRGGQFLIAFYTYPVLKRAMLYRLETNGMPLSVYSSLSIDRISPWFMFTLVTRRYREGSSRHPNTCSHGPGSSSMGMPTFLGFLYICGYILLFQTVLSISTSYQARLAPAVVDPSNDNGLVDMEYMRIPGLIIRDGSRVGLADDTPTCFAGLDPDGLCQLFFDYASVSRTLINTSRREPQALEQSSISGDAEGSHWTLWRPESTSDGYHSNFTMDGKQYYLQPPILNIEAVTYGEGSDLQIFKTTKEAWDESETTLQYYTIHGDLLGFSQVEGLVRCIPSANYEWGFSFLMLFTFFFLTVIFLVILAVLRYKVHWHSRVDVLRPEMSTYRDILDMAQDLRRSIGQEAEVMSCAEIREAVKERDSGVTLDLSGLPLSRRHRRRGSSRGSAAPVLDSSHESILLSSLSK